MKNNQLAVPREVRQDINSRTYKDTLEQYVEQKAHDTVRPPSDVRQSMPTLSRKSPQEEEQSKKNFANFYGVDPGDASMYVQFTRQHVAQSDNYAPESRQTMSQKLPPVGRRQSNQKKQVDEQTIFMKQAIDSNILLKRDANSFFEGKGQETSSNFVRNYNEFYRGYSQISFRSTPDKETKQVMDKYGGGEIDEKKALGGSKKDVYLYDFFVHKPKYVYTTEASRLNRGQRHYDKFANDPKFKKAAGNFFGIENEFQKPDYSRRGPVTREDQVTSRNFESLSKQSVWRPCADSLVS